MDVLAVAESQVVGSAPVGEPTELQLKFFGVGATGHEHDTIAIPVVEVLKVFEDFFGIEDGSYHKLQLVFTATHERLNDLGGEASGVVSVDPGFVGVSDGARVAEFRADGPEVTLCGLVDGACGFDGQMFTASADSGGKFGDFIEDHRFAAGEDDVSNFRLFDGLED